MAEQIDGGRERLHLGDPSDPPREQGRREVDATEDAEGRDHPGGSHRRLEGNQRGHEQEADAREGEAASPATARAGGIPPR